MVLRRGPVVTLWFLAMSFGKPDITPSPPPVTPRALRGLHSPSPALPEGIPREELPVKVGDEASSPRRSRS
jgi:hypothetical protein